MNEEINKCKYFLDLLNAQGAIQSVKQCEAVSQSI